MEEGKVRDMLYHPLVGGFSGILRSKLEHSVVVTV